MIRLTVALTIFSLMAVGCNTAPKGPNPLFQPPSGNPFADKYFEPPDGQMQYDPPVKPAKPSSR